MGIDQEHSTLAAAETGCVGRLGIAIRFRGWRLVFVAGGGFLFVYVFVFLFVGRCRLFWLGRLRSRVELLQFGFERLTEAICKKGIGAYGIGNNVEHVLARKLVGDVLVEPVLHGHDVYRADVGTRDLSGSGQHGKQKQRGPSHDSHHDSSVVEPTCRMT